MLKLSTKFTIFKKQTIALEEEQPGNGLMTKTVQFRKLFI